MFIKVDKQHPCPICGKPDWCLYTPDGELVLCPRTPEGSIEVTKAGYLHRLKETTPGSKKRFERRVHPREPTIDAHGLALDYSTSIEDEQIIPLADQLGVSLQSLRLLRIGWCEEQRAFTFPMRNGKREIIGIRTRHEDGAYRAINGSRAGLFIPHHFACRKLFICEGPSDTAMMLTLGIPAIGLPSCWGDGNQVAELCKRNKIKSVTIIADHDKQDRFGKRPGREGAVRLIKQLGFGDIIRPPGAFKDVREAGRAIITRIERFYEEHVSDE